MPYLGTTNSARPSAIIFDIGRVIVRVDMARAFALLGESGGPSPQEVWKALEPTPQWRDWQEGRLAPDQFHQYICAILGRQTSFEQFRHAWNAMLDPEPLLSDEVFGRLATRFQLALLSNTDAIHSAHMESTYSFIRYFPVRVYSWQAGIAKPAPEIYRIALRALGVSPSDALFIDDVYENAAAAWQLGIPALHSTSTEELVSELARFA